MHGQESGGLYTVQTGWCWQLPITPRVTHTSLVRFCSVSPTTRPRHFEEIALEMAAKLGFGGCGKACKPDGFVEAGASMEQLCCSLEVFLVQVKVASKQLRYHAEL